ncbi:hypothetical protein F2Q69_00063184 [Brassica cretica]|uniref:Uncharacterized protein n=1 Tax=Brassica cretica TaxID=69181 RepID=A0A8S9RBG0_BRACR|nr:hypothetical protein F2Q69_00063184 [Brassica cretica]
MILEKIEESLLQHLHVTSFFLEPKLLTTEIMVKKLGTLFQLLQIGTEEEQDEKVRYNFLSIQRGV